MVADTTRPAREAPGERLAAGDPYEAPSITSVGGCVETQSGRTIRHGFAFHGRPAVARAGDRSAGRFDPPESVRSFFPRPGSGLPTCSHVSTATGLCPGDPNDATGSEHQPRPDRRRQAAKGQRQDDHHPVSARPVALLRIRARASRRRLDLVVAGRAAGVARTGRSRLGNLAADRRRCCGRTGRGMCRRLGGRSGRRLVSRARGRHGG
jgi:hypothetical protein